MAKAKRSVPEGYSTVTPALVLDDAAAAIAWYGKAFGAEELNRSVGADGKIMHAELKLGDSRVMVNDAVMGMKVGAVMEPAQSAQYPVQFSIDFPDRPLNRLCSGRAAPGLEAGDGAYLDRWCGLDPAGHPEPLTVADVLRYRVPGEDP